VRKNGIFGDSGLLDKFHEIDKLMIEALGGATLKGWSPTFQSRKNRGSNAKGH
jgi:hypothetical protein